jgi:hypothetical protein
LGKDEDKREEDEDTWRNDEGRREEVEDDSSKEDDDDSANRDGKWLKRLNEYGQVSWGYDYTMLCVVLGGEEVKYLVCYEERPEYETLLLVHLTAESEQCTP